MILAVPALAVRDAALGTCSHVAVRIVPELLHTAQVRHGVFVSRIVVGIRRPSQVRNVANGVVGVTLRVAVVRRLGCIRQAVERIIRELHPLVGHEDCAALELFVVVEVDTAAVDPIMEAPRFASRQPLCKGTAHNRIAFLIDFGVEAAYIVAAAWPRFRSTTDLLFD